MWEAAGVEGVDVDGGACVEVLDFLLMVWKIAGPPPTSRSFFSSGLIVRGVLALFGLSLAFG